MKWTLWFAKRVVVFKDGQVREDRPVRGRILRRKWHNVRTLERQRICLDGQGFKKSQACGASFGWVRLYCLC